MIGSTSGARIAGPTSGLKPRCPVHELTLSILLTDDIYKKWYSTVPKLTAHGVQPPWRVWVQTREGKWYKLKQDFRKYSEAYNWVAKNRKTYRDCVIYSKRMEFKPPVVKYKEVRTYWPTPRGHVWCGFCRRPTEFHFYQKHHAIQVLDENVKRCSICGVRQTFLKKYSSNMVSKLLQPSFES